MEKSKIKWTLYAFLSEMLTKAGYAVLGFSDALSQKAVSFIKESENASQALPGAHTAKELSAYPAIEYECSNYFCGWQGPYDDLRTMPGLFNDSDCCPVCSSSVRILTSNIQFVEPGF